MAIFCIEVLSVVVSIGCEKKKVTAPQHLWTLSVKKGPHTIVSLGSIASNVVDSVGLAPQ